MLFGVTTGGFGPVAAVMAAVAILIGSLGSSEAARGQGSDALFGRGFVSTKVLKDGEPVELVGSSRLRVEFEHRSDHDVVRWQSGCNTYGARVEVRGHRLRTGQITGTAVGCGPARDRQDARFVRLFKRDPRWALRGRRLELTADRWTIKLIRRP